MKIRTETMVFDDARLSSTIEQTAEHILLEVSEGYYNKTQIDQTSTAITALINDETDNRTTLIRAKSGGVITAYQGQTYGVYTNASGSVDIVTLSWSGATPTITSTLASYGTSITLGSTSGKHLVIDSNNVSAKNGQYLLSSFGVDGLHIYGGNGISLAQIGYKEGYDGINTDAGYAPYFSQGTGNDNSGKYSLVSGVGNSLHAGYAYAIGEGNINNGQSSGCSGYSNEITEMQYEKVIESGRVITIGGGYASHAFGAYLVASKAFQTVVGVANEIDTSTFNYDSDPVTSLVNLSRGEFAFIVGNGAYRYPIHSPDEQDVSRSNAFTVAWTGETTVNAKGYSSNQARLCVSINGTKKVWLGVGSGGDDHGIYSVVHSKWIIAADANGVIRSPAIYGNTASGTVYNVQVNSNGLLKRASSSRRYKKDIQILCDDELNPEKLYDLQVSQFKYKKQEKGDARYDKLIPGFIAEDVAKVYPIAACFNGDKVEDWEIRHIVPPMLQLIQQQKKTIDSLNKRISKLEKMIA